jgi:hypothetical protein
MQTLFKSFFERLIDGIVVLIVSGLIVHWTIDMQRHAARQGRIGLVSLTRINQQLFWRVR